MQCFIYKSNKKNELYLYVKDKDNFSAIPETLLNSFGQLEFVMELELTSKRKLAREDVNKVLDNLHEKGFYVQMPPTIMPDTLRVKNTKLH